MTPTVKKILSLGEDDLHFATALRLARRAESGVLEDITNGATHYHATGISPHWIHGANPVMTIGRHIFYRLEG